MAPSVLGGALVWWRFYTFYLYVVFGALAAGRTVMRALRDVAHRAWRDPEVERPPAITTPGIEREGL